MPTLYETGTGQLIYVHDRDVCDAVTTPGVYCPIHKQSYHIMRDWPTHWREDRGLMERMCPHGIGHPDPDDRQLQNTPAAGVHGCDGCCVQNEIAVQEGVYDDDAI